MIRNQMYTKYLSEISVLAKKLDNVLDEIPTCSEHETMEETEIRHSISKAAESLNDAKSNIKHFSKGTREGYLKKNSQGKFYIQFANGEESYDLSCGNSIEVHLVENTEKHIEKGWYPGRVEYSNEYYFYGPGNPILHTYMRVRIRD